MAVSARNHARREAREQQTLRAIALSFFALAGYVAASAVWELLGGGKSDTSTIGLILAATSLVVMPVLSTGQRRAGRELDSRSAVADSRQTMLCTYLSAALLVGLALHSLFGWTWADPAAALVIAAFAVREGRTAWRADPCCGPTGCPATEHAPTECAETARAETTAPPSTTPASTR